MSGSRVLSLVRVAARAAEDKLGKDIVALDVRPQTAVTDCFLFVSGSSHIHVRALEDAVREAMQRAGARLIRTDGQRGHHWRALDYGGLIVHIMEKDAREFYSIERLWDQGKKISLSSSLARQSGQARRRRARSGIQKIKERTGSGLSPG